MQYLREGRVNKLELVGEEVTARVQGSQLYRVKLDLGEEDFAGRCSCPYDWGGYCKHIVATLLKLSKDVDELRASAEERKMRIRRALENASERDLRQFLEKELERGAKLQRRFLLAFGDVEGERELEDYKRELRRLYEELTDEYGYVPPEEEIDFSAFHERAETCADKGDFLEAAKIYRAISEVILEKMDRVDDFSGDYDYEFRLSINRYAEILAEKDLDFAAKKRHLDYLFDKYIGDGPDYYQDYYYEALKELCSTKADYEHWKKRYQPHLPDGLPEGERRAAGRFEAMQDLLAYADILEELGEGEELQELFEENYLEEGEFCVAYVRWLKETGRGRRGIEVAKEGIKEFGGSVAKQLREYLSDLY